MSFGFTLESLVDVVIFEGDDEATDDEQSTAKASSVLSTSWDEG